MTTVDHGQERTVLRTLGINESYQLAMYLLDQYRGTCLSCRYVIPQSLAPAESRVELKQAVNGAVVDTVMRHPMLHVGIKDASSKTPSWIQLPSLDLTQHIKWISIGKHEDFEQKVQESFCAQIDDRFADFSVEQPHWKMTILRQEDAPMMEVLLTWNHTHFDGAGAKVFHQDFLDVLRAEKGARHRSGLDSNVVWLPQAPPMLPTPIERLANLSLDITHLAKVLWEEYRPSFLSRDASLAAWCPIRASPYKTQFRAFFIDQTTLLAILGLCRKNKTTITALLNGLALISFSSQLDSTVAQAFQSATIIDHRRNLPAAPPDAPWGPSDKVVSNYVTQAFHKYDTQLVARIRSKLSSGGGEERDLPDDLQRELWAVSAQNRLEIVARLEAGLRNDLVGVFQYVTDWQQTLKGMANKTRQFTWLVTNVGVMGRNTSAKPGTAGDDDKSNKDTQEWSLERAQFGLSTEVPSAALVISPVSVAGRGMCIGASWADCAVDVSLGERVMADLERWLTQMAMQ